MAKLKLTKLFVHYNENTFGPSTDPHSKPVILLFKNGLPNIYRHTSSTHKPFEARTCIHQYLFVVPLMVKSDMFLFIHYPVLYLYHDVLKQEIHNVYRPISS